MNRRLVIVATATLVALSSAPALAQFKDVDAAIDYREAAMTLLGSHFGRMAPVAKKEAPYDKEAIRANVAILNTLATLPWAGFGEGTEGGDAKDKIWQDREGFKQAEDKFHAGMKKLTSAADAGDFDAFRVAFGEVGKSCKSCHDAYREKN